MFVFRRTHTVAFSGLGISRAFLSAAFVFAFFLALDPAVALAQTTINVPKDQPTIQAGINAAQNGDTVLVAPGTYTENIDFMGKAITVMSSGGAATTIIDGKTKGPTVAFESSESRSSIIQGFTIQNGGQGVFNLDISGVFAANSAPSIIGNIIQGSRCNDIHLDLAAALIQNNEIRLTGDTVGQCSFAGGSAIWVDGFLKLSPYTNVILSNIIEDNTQSGVEDAGGNGGAAIAVWGAEGTVIQGNVLRNNATMGNGGAILFFNGDSILLVQNLVYGNTASEGNGGISLMPPSDSVGPFFGLLVNNTIVGNKGVIVQGEQPVASQLYLDGNLGQYALVNNIVAGNDSLPALICGKAYSYLSLTPVVIDHNDIFNSSGPAYGGACPDQTGTHGNISADPLFENASGSDYHLTADSPAIDAGNNSAFALLADVPFYYGLESVVITVPTDLDGNPREQDATGKGYPIVDMGAYEYAGVQVPGATTVVLTPSAYELNGGTDLTLTAKLLSPNGTPAGNVTFSEDQKVIGVSAIDGTGSASLAVPSVVPGIHAFLANYPGQNSATPAVSVKIYVLVDRYGVTLTVTSTPNPSIVGQLVGFAGKVSTPDGVPSGSLVLSDGSTTLATLTPDGNGNVSYSTSSLALGTHAIDLSYAGDTTHLSGQAQVSQQVISGYPTSLALSSSLNPASHGQTVTFTATVTSANGSPNGNVVFTDGSTTLATGTLSNGSAVYSTSALATGSHTITATYQSSGGFAGSSASLTQVINGLASATTLTVAPGVLHALQPATLTATVRAVSGAPTGSVTFTDNGTSVGSATIAGGVANIAWTPAGAGSHILLASYSGDTSFNASASAPFSQSVAINDSETSGTATPNPAGAFQSTSLMVKVASMSASAFGAAPAGAVTFYDGTTNLGMATLNANATATLAVSTFQAGTHSLTAVYGGNPAFASSSSSPYTLVVNPDSTTTTLSVTPNPAVVGTPVSFIASVAALGVPSGTVNFYDGSVLVGTGTLDGKGNAAFITSSLALGSHSIFASYPATPNFNVSVSSVVNYTIIAYAGDFSIAASPGSRSVYTGEASSFTVMLAPTGGWNQNVGLTCGELPANTVCAFSPAAVAGASGTSVMTIQTSAPHHVAALGQRDSFPWRGWTGAATLSSLALLLLPRRLRRWSLLCAVLAISAFGTMNGCGTPGPIAGGTPPGTYNITVTASFSQSGQTDIHSTVVTLVVKSLF